MHLLVTHYQARLGLIMRLSSTSFAPRTSHPTGSATSTGDVRLRRFESTVSSRKRCLTSFPWRRPSA
jgi:hypothetical protein